VGSMEFYPEFLWIQSIYYVEFNTNCADREHCVWN
jgi:hypothetical protein